MFIRNSTLTILSVAVFSAAATTISAQEWKSGVEWQEPPLVTPGATNDAAPSDAVVLFDGTNLDQWIDGGNWKVEDGLAIPQKSQIVSKQHFGDMQLHVEWSAPTEIRGEGQGRGNSGIFLMGLYEVQVLDSFENTTYFDGQAGSIYKQTPPLANAMRKPGDWNYYDIIFTVPKFKGNGDIDKPGHVTLMQNGVLMLNHFELMGPTGFVSAPHHKPHAETGPISLQFHGDAVKFRNIWVREFKAPVGHRTGPPFNIEAKKKKEDPMPKEKEDETIETKKDSETDPEVKSPKSQDSKPQQKVRAFGPKDEKKEDAEPAPNDEDAKAT